MTNTNHWQKHGLNWQLLDTPLRPNNEDISFITQKALPIFEAENLELKRVAILGVTPEFARLPFPENTEIVAIDNSPAMIANVWESANIDKKKKCRSILSDWRNLPLEDNSCNLVFADGSFTLLSYPQDYHKVLQQITRILKPKGILSVRLFLRPTKTETLAHLFSELEAGEIANFHFFKWRLIMALQDETSEGIAVAKAYDVWQKTITNPEQLMNKLGWQVELLNTINVYQNSPNIYYFPTLEQIRQLFAPYLKEMSCNFPSYQSGEIFPTIVFQNS